MHIPLNGFVAGPNAEMNRSKVDEEIFDHVGKCLSGVLIVPRWRGKYFYLKVFSNLGLTKMLQLNPPPLDDLKCSTIRLPSRLSREGHCTVLF
jgi:hypothetical protein